MTEQDTQTGTSETTVDDLHYGYDHVGNVLSEADTPSGVPAATDSQCFTYDYLGRLAQAWAQGTSECAAAPTASAEGGAAPYWSTYTYNTTGDLTGITSTNADGIVSTTADTYPAGGAARPHAITTQTVSSASGETETEYGYDATGNLTSATGPSQDQTLSWNDSGQLVKDSVTPAEGTAADTTFTYDANGSLLITADPGTTTLYLADEELSLNSATGSVTGTWYYTLGSGVVATRIGSSSVDYLVGEDPKVPTLPL